MEYEFTATLYRWESRQADTWVFVNLPEALADEILEAGEQVPRGFGSLRVEVRVGATAWRTSIFPSTGAGTFVLPLKKAVRKAQGLEVGDEARVHLRLVDV